MSLWLCRLTSLKRRAAEMNKDRLIQNMAARFVHSNCNLGRFAVVAVFLLSFFVSSAWGACRVGTDCKSDITLQTSCSVGTNIGYGCSLKNAGAVASSLSGCGKCITPYQCNPGYLKITSASYRCGSSSYVDFCYESYTCDTQCDADSVACEIGGGTWTNTGASTCDGKSCKMSNCLQSDTLWLNDSKAACDAIGGENNYAIADIDETCVHSGICCPPDSALVGNTCKWRCDSLYAACTAKNGYLYAGVLQDTTISGSDSTFTNKCYYNCSYAYNKDSTTSVTDGNTACSSPSTPIADCTRMPNDFSSVRTTYGDSVYSYDFLTPGSAAYIDSIVLTPCSRFMYRCTINGKYRYWYSDADIPTGCTNIVKIK